MSTKKSKKEIDRRLLDGVTYEIGPDETPISRAIIIGDVHGCAVELEELLSACEYEPLSDLVILVGDLIGKGPASRDVVRYVRTRLPRVVSIMGNHDEVLAEYHRALLHEQAQFVATNTVVEGASSSESASVWCPLSSPTVHDLPAASSTACAVAPSPAPVALTVEQRAKVLEQCSIKDAYLHLYENELNEEDRAFLCTMPLWCRLPRTCFAAEHACETLPDEVVIVHAGIDPRKSLERQKRKHLLNMRTICSDGKPSKAGEGDGWVNSWHGPQLIVFGHDAVRGLQLTEFAVGLDTGCCYGKALTALILPERRIVAVPAHEMYSAPNIPLGYSSMAPAPQSSVDHTKDPDAESCKITDESSSDERSARRSFQPELPRKLR